MKRVSRFFIAFIACFGIANLSVADLHGEMVIDQVHGESLEGNNTGESPDRTVAVYLPISYAASPDRRYPVLYLLHGIGGTHRDWIGSSDQEGTWNTIQDVMDRGTADQLFSEMIVVAPDEMTRGGGSFYTNSAATGAWRSFTVVDLVQYIDSNYRTLARASSRGIAGHSMGGYGAIKIGMMHPDVFQVVYGMSSALLGWAGDVSAENSAYARAAEATPATLNPREDIYPVSLICVAQAFSPNLEHPPFLMDLPFELRDGRLQEANPAHARWTKNMLLYVVDENQENLRALRALRFDVGRYDQYSHIPPTNRALSERLHEFSIPHTFEEYNGDHRDKLWGRGGRIATEVLPFFSRSLEFD